MRAILAGSCGIALFAGSLRAATPEQINQSIARGVAYLYSRQHDGRWEPDDHRDGLAHNFQTVGERMQGDVYGGFSALAVYALLSAGESPRDKRIVDAVNFLKHADAVGIYAVGLRGMVWHMLATTKKEQTELHQYIQADADRILNGVNQSGPSAGLWEYGNGIGPRVDHSVSQYGILGLWALQDAGAQIPPRAWPIFDQVWKSGQFPDGGWAYTETPAAPGKRGSAAASPAMTAAGVATLFIIQDNLEPTAGNAKTNVVSPNIELGLKWMAAHIGQVNNNYGWYGVQRIGVASGTKYFGTTDWFQYGADKLIAAQTKNGSWPEPDGLGNPVTATSFAVLFLSRGSSPVMINKLRYDVLDDKGRTVEGYWNERPRDVANIARWTGEQIESNLNWQLVNLDVPAEELRDAPILYIAGDGALKFTDDQVQKLKTFVEEGGLILGNADFNSRPFADSFQELGTKMFGYEFRALPPTSPVWSEQSKLTHSRLKLAGLSNGVRELMLLADPGDVGRAWQLPPEGEHPEAQELGANIFLYAVDKKNLSIRGVSPVVIPDAKIKNTKLIRVARVKYGANWDPEPGGWRRLSAIFHNTHHTDIDVQTCSLGHNELNPQPDQPANAPKPLTDAEIRKIAFKRITPEQMMATEGDVKKLDALLKPKIAEVKKEQADAAAKLAAKALRFKLAAITGTTAFDLSDIQLAELRKYIDGGGTLVIDAAGGASDFAASAEIMLRKLCPDSAEQGLQSPLAPIDPLYTLRGNEIPRVQYRMFARTVLGSLHDGRVFGIREHGRIVVYYSKEDLSAGLVGEAMDGIVGYTPDVATEIMRNIVLLADGAPAH